MPAAVLTSVIVSDSPQADGRRWIQERHTDQYGNQYPRFYLCAAPFDASGQLAGNATQLIADLNANEIAANVAQVSAVGSLASPTFLFSTAAQNATALRTAYQSATQLQAVMMGDYLNTLTDAQLQNAFGLTLAQVTSLRTNKLVPAVSLAASVRASAGQ